MSIIVPLLMMIAMMVGKVMLMWCSGPWWGMVLRRLFSPPSSIDLRPGKKMVLNGAGVPFKARRVGFSFWCARIREFEFGIRNLIPRLSCIARADRITSSDDDDDDDVVNVSSTLAKLRFVAGQQLLIDLGFPNLIIIKTHMEAILGVILKIILVLAFIIVLIETLIAVLIVASVVQQKKEGSSVVLTAKPPKPEALEAYPKLEILNTNA